jgi:hypothetical protein
MSTVRTLGRRMAALPMALLALPLAAGCFARMETPCDTSVGPAEPAPAATPTEVPSAEGHRAPSAPTPPSCVSVREAPQSACELGEVRSGVPLRGKVREACGNPGKTLRCETRVRDGAMHVELVGTQCGAPTGPCLQRTFECDIDPLPEGGDGYGAWRPKIHG